MDGQETKAKLGKIWVRTQWPRGEEYKEELIEVDKFDTTPGTAFCSAGMTLNLGNYESLRVDVGVTVPCYKEEKDAAMDEIVDWVKERLTKEINQIKKEL